MDYGTLGYNLVKSAHIVSFTAWMAGMFYLPRLFVYHAEAERGSVQSETFKVMERRLLRAIITPAMIATLVFGIWLAVAGGWWRAPWLHAKLLFVVVLLGLHGYFARTVRTFAADANARPARFYRLINEVPTVAFVIIVLLAITKLQAFAG